MHNDAYTPVKVMGYIYIYRSNNDDQGFEPGFLESSVRCYTN